MDYNITGQYMVVGGAGSGFGRAVTERLIKEGAHVLAVSRSMDKLESLAIQYPDNVECMAADLTDISTHQQICDWMKVHKATGVVFNAGGPPAGGFVNMPLEEWDQAYHQVLRWKINLANKIVPLLKEQKYGRMLFVESISVKQPVPNLVLSNAMRSAVASAAKTLSNEVASDGITVNVMAPGYHDTHAVRRIFQFQSQQRNISEEAVRDEFLQKLPLGSLGTAEEFAVLALWLLSPWSRYVTGQTLMHDGGLYMGY